MAQTINDLDVDERLRCTLRTAVANGFLNTHAIEFSPIMRAYPSLKGHLSFYLPNTIGEMKQRAACIAAYLKDAGQDYKRKSIPDEPAATEKAPTSRYLIRTYKGIFNAFNAVLMEEGLAPLVGIHMQSGQSDPTRTDVKKGQYVSGASVAGGPTG